MKKKSTFIKYLFLSTLVASQVAYATAPVITTQSVTANIAFDTALTITPVVAAIEFGTVEALVASVYKVDTTGTLTVVTGSGKILTGTPAAANLSIAGSTTQTITITVDTYAANNGVTPQNAICDYNSAGEVGCNTLVGVAAPGAGKTLLIGVEADVSGTQAAASSAAPTFNVNVVYT